MYSELKHIVKKNKLDNEIVKSSNKVLLVDRFSLDLNGGSMGVIEFLEIEI